MQNVCTLPSSFYNTSKVAACARLCIRKVQVGVT